MVRGLFHLERRLDLDGHIDRVDVDELTLVAGSPYDRFIISLTEGDLGMDQTGFVLRTSGPGVSQLNVGLLPVEH
jgi:hypothetical protein